MSKTLKLIIHSNSSGGHQSHLCILWLNILRVCTAEEVLRKETAVSTFKMETHRVKQYGIESFG